MDNCEAYDYCANHTLGLAMWDTRESYMDIKYLAAHSAIHSDFYTALNNANNVACNGGNDCTMKLLWRQTKTGYCDVFNRNAGFHSRYVALFVHEI